MVGATLLSKTRLHSHELWQGRPLIAVVRHGEFEERTTLLEMWRRPLGVLLRRGQVGLVTALVVGVKEVEVVLRGGICARGWCSGGNVQSCLLLLSGRG